MATATKVYRTIALYVKPLERPQMRWAKVLLSVEESKR